MSPTQPTGWVEWHAAIPICSFCGRSGYDRRLDHKSRMGREFHVRFREGLGVKVPRATRLLLGFIGTKEEATVIKSKIRDWLRDNLKLELSEEKTLITHAGTDAARFLGYEVSVIWSESRPTVNGNIKLTIPEDKVQGACGRYMREGKPIHRAELTNDSDFDIIAR